jgi:DNA (cytosine-5)-methyltransferase 1
LLDLFCSGGGAGEGYRQAGFDVVGVDIVRRACGYPCGDLIIKDAKEVLQDMDFLQSFDAIHASPPCQTHSRTQHLRDAQGKNAAVIDMIPETKVGLAKAWVPYVIENVEGAPLRQDLLLCGSMFDNLAVYDKTGRRWLKRHRIFESNVPLSPPKACDHKGAGVRPLGVYGSKSDNIPSGGQTCRSLEEGRKLMGIPWMSWKALTEAIPPAYTKHIGTQLLEHINGL